MIRVYVAYHHPVIRESLANALARDAAIQVVGRRSGKDGLADVARLRPDVLVLSEPGSESAADLVTRYRDAAPGIKIVLLDSGANNGSGADVELASEGTACIVQAAKSVAS